MEKKTSLKPIGHQEGQGETFRHELKPLFVVVFLFPQGSLHSTYKDFEFIESGPFRLPKII